MNLTELRDALAKATGPDEELDANILETVVGFKRRRGEDRILDAWWNLDGQRMLGHPPRYTASIDAAVTLAADGDWGVSWAVESVFATGFPGNTAVVAYVWRDHPVNEASYCRSPGCIDFKAAIQHLPRLICLARVEYELAKGESPIQCSDVGVRV